MFLRAAELLSTTWRSTLNAATMLGQSKTAFQAEIDAASQQKRDEELEQLRTLPARLEFLIQQKDVAVSQLEEAQRELRTMEPLVGMLQGDELELKNARNYGGPDFTAAAGNRLHQHFGLLIASCEGADLRPLPSGVMIYANEARRLEPLPAPKVQRAEVIDELYGAIVEGKPPRHDGNWGAATLEVCLAILRSSREGREIALPAPTASRT